jgi:mannose-6-phosphate isomerase
MDAYPLTFQPIYKEKIWGGRNLQRLFGRDLPPGKDIGESWELADLEEGTSVTANGPLAGKTLTDLTAEMGDDLLGGARPLPGGRFPLLLKLLDANDTLSLQVHPDAEAAKAIGRGAAMKTECWYVVESRAGAIYRGLKPGVTPEAFRRAVEAGDVHSVVQRIEARSGDFFFLPAGTVHALGAGIVVAEVQTPSDTTYRVTDWGRGREIHLEMSMRCIHFEPPPETAPGAAGTTLLATPFFAVAKRAAGPTAAVTCPQGTCLAMMVLEAEAPIEVSHDGATETAVPVAAGGTVLLPAALERATVFAPQRATWLEITLPSD